MEEVARLNMQWISALSYDEVKPLLDDKNLQDVDEVFWLNVRSNLQAINELDDWVKILNQPISPLIEDIDFSKQAASLIPEGVLTETSWEEWVNAVKNETGRKGKSLFMPLRKALTGREDGPELKVIFPMIGREKAIKRLHGEAA
jgi:glutamyl-tRNA synthetase